jgi:ribosome biogenesis GTPase A
MRVRYSFSSRRTRNIKKISKQKKTYPELLKNIIETSDIILEVLDARFPQETRNKDIEYILKKQKKKIIYVLNKSDLVKNPQTTLRPSVFVSCKSRKGIKDLRNKIKLEAKKIKKDSGKIQVGVIGYPNTGKSSVINILIGKSSAGTGAEAGFTKGIQKISLTSEIVLLDSPGVIPKREYSATDQKSISDQTKIGGRSYQQVKNPELVVNDLVKDYKKQLEKFYKMKIQNEEDLIEKLGNKKNIFKKKGEVNEDKVARMILKDWQEGKIKI